MEKKRNLYLSNTPAEEARQLFLSEVQKNLSPRYETIPVSDSLNRVTRKAVYAKCNAPNYNAAAMDGAAVANRKEGAAEGRLDNWGEVVTR